MTSIMTNTAAMTALQTLQSTNNMLESTQNRISTGYRVSEASDNAAYWSIATTMRSDNKSMSAVVDSLGMGAATVDTAYTGMTAVKDVLDEIKAKLTTATGENIDKAKVQSEIKQLQEQLTSIADSASFSGENWLSVDSDATGYSATSSIISSFARDSGGALSLGSINVDTTKTALFDAGATSVGLLEQGMGNSSAGGLDALTETAAVDTTSGEVQTGGTFASMTLDADDSISFDIAVDGAATPTTITIDKALIDTALTSTDGVIGSAADFATVINAALTTATLNTDVVASDASGAIAFTSQDTAAATSDVAITNVKVDNGGNLYGVADIDITTADRAQIDDYIKSIDSMSESVISAAADLGAIKTRVDMQTGFVGNLMNAIDRGIGTLVDADMTEESTMLKALQTQQQLGVQALSIANQSSQSLLTLFR